MKKLLVILNIIAIFSAKAYADTYVCDVNENDQTISFRLIEELPSEEGWDRVAKFELSLQTTELPFPSHTEYGTVKEDDVYFKYVSDTSDIEFSMFLDDDENVDFTFNGEQLSFSGCYFF